MTALVFIATFVPHIPIPLGYAHLGDAPLVQAYAADELDVEMPHSEHAPRRLAHDRERLGQDLLHRRALCKLLACGFGRWDDRDKPQSRTSKAGRYKFKCWCG